MKPDRIIFPEEHRPEVVRELARGGIRPPDVTFSSSTESPDQGAARTLVLYVHAPPRNPEAIWEPQASRAVLKPYMDALKAALKPHRIRVKQDRTGRMRFERRGGFDPAELARVLERFAKTGGHRFRVDHV
jgi:hypothetical protein